MSEENGSRESALAQIIALRKQNRYGEALRAARRLQQSAPHDQQLADLIADLRASTHWTMIPLWPVTRLGWVGALIVWGILILLPTAARVLGYNTLSGVLAAALLLYIGYSWVWPPRLKKMLR